MDKCPFCGAKIAQMLNLFDYIAKIAQIGLDPFDYICNFECGTIMKGKHGPKRGNWCYETQLKIQTDQLKECLVVVQDIHYCLGYGTGEDEMFYYVALKKNTVKKSRRPITQVVSGS